MLRSRLLVFCTREIIIIMFCKPNHIRSIDLHLTLSMIHFWEPLMAKSKRPTKNMPLENTKLLLGMYNWAKQTLELKQSKIFQLIHLSASTLAIFSRWSAAKISRITIKWWFTTMDVQAKPSSSWLQWTAATGLPSLITQTISQRKTAPLYA